MGSFFDWLFILGVLQVLFLIFLFIGIPLILLRFFLRGGGRGSSGRGPEGNSADEAPLRRRRWGFPTSMYTGSSGLGSFKMDEELFNFRTPKPTPNLSRLREKPKVDLERAKGLFVGSPLRLPEHTLNLDKARELFVPRQGGLLDFIYQEEEEGDVEED